MTLERNESIECPSCHQSQGMVLWDSLNVTVTPSGKKELLEGRLNVFHCEKCGHQEAVDIPFVYHDMDLKFWISYFPVDSLKDYDFYLLFEGNGQQKLPAAQSEIIDILGEGSAYMNMQHIVFDMDEVLRYVIFREVLAHQQSGAAARHPFLDP